jgi:pyridoxal phosphate enzyme (YggS family)
VADVTVAERLAAVRERVAAAAARSGRSPDDVTIVAVSKAQPDDRVRAAYDAGHRSFGENRAGGLVDHVDLLPGDVDWHFVGRLQSNKARVVRPRVVALHSMDRASLAEAWLKGPGSPPPVYVQVDLAGEPQKGGVVEADAGALVERCRALGIEVLGLMVLPPLDDDPRRWFAGLAALRDRLEPTVGPLPGLSMGMSADFEVAVEEGSTVIRVGTTIFGDRPHG